jgi:AcrR family transcriptional regulator
MIAKEAGVANGTLFHYYPTKDELIVALYTEIKGGLSKCVLAGDGVEGEAIKDKWKRYYSAAIEWGVENPMEFRFTQQFISSPYLAMVSELKKQSQMTLDMIREGIKMKLIKNNEPELYNTILTSNVYGVNQYIVDAKLSYPERKKVINKSFEMLWNMMTG